MRKLSWYKNRLLVMSPAEILYRVKQQFQTKVLDVFHSLGMRKSYLDSAVSINWPAYDKKLILAWLGKDAGEDPHVKIFKCNFRVDDYAHWRQDPASGIISAICFSGYINKQCYDKVGDFKYVSVASRLHHLSGLALKVVATREQNLLVKLEQQLKQWSLQNPYLRSINWTSGIEVAIRAVNICLALTILKQNQVLPRSLELLVIGLLDRHYHFLLTHPSLYSSANNHRIAELCGLVVIASITKPKREKSVGVDQHLAEIYSEMSRQVFRDGVNREQSLSYHCESLEFYFVALLFARRSGLHLPVAYMELLSRMLSVLTAFYDVNVGHESKFGDSDDGYLIGPFWRADFSLFQSLCETRGILTDDKVGKRDFRNFILFGDGYSAEDLRISAETADLSTEDFTLLSESGYFISRINNSYLRFDCGPLGMPPMCAHGHADMLSFALNIGTSEVLIDPGTYQYHSRYARERDYFRGTSAHNTVSFRGKDQAQSGGRMIWLSTPANETISVSQNMGVLEASGAYSSHTAEYGKTAHRRTIKQSKGINEIVVSDRLNVDSEACCYAFLHFHPEVSLVSLSDCILRMEIADLEVAIEYSGFDEAQLIKGSFEPFLGWCSPEFDRILPSYTLRTMVAVCDFRLTQFKIKWWGKGSNQAAQ